MDGQPEQLAAHLHQEQVRHRDRARQLQREAGPLAGHRGDRELAAQRLDRPLDRVEADAAAGDLCRDLPGGDAGEEGQLDRLPGGEAGGGLRRQRAVLDRAPAQRLGVDAAAVVLQVDQHPVALAAGLQRQLAARQLPGGGAVGGGLDAVVDRVADQVAERVAHRLDHRPVELDLGPLHLEVDLLAQLVGEVADRAREPLGERGERRQPRVHHLVVQLAREAPQAVDLGLESRPHVLGQLAGRFAEAGDAAQHLAGRIEQLVQRLGPHPHGGGGLAGAALQHRRRRGLPRRVGRRHRVEPRRRQLWRLDRADHPRVALDHHLHGLDLGHRLAGGADLVGRPGRGDAGGDPRGATGLHQLRRQRLHLQQRAQPPEAALDDHRAGPGRGALRRERDHHLPHRQRLLAGQLLGGPHLGRLGRVGRVGRGGLRRPADVLGREQLGLRQQPRRQGRHVGERLARRGLGQRVAGSGGQLAGRVLQQLVERVARLQQEVDPHPARRHPRSLQPADQRLRRVGDRHQPLQLQRRCRALDRVDPAEDRIPQHRWTAGGRLERDQLRAQPGELVPGFTDEQREVLPVRGHGVAVSRRAPS